MKKSILISIACSIILVGSNIYSQQAVKITKGKIKAAEGRIQGFIGSYHPYKGVIYGGFGWKEGQLVQDAFSFGENAVISEASYSGYIFKENIINNCVKWNVNQLYGILAGVSEKGSVNHPGDTLLYKPAADLPGMIQGAHRFSELSKIYPQIRGIIIDDFYYNYPKDLSIEDLREIKDALLGKHMDAEGHVDHDSKATTPNLKLFIVVYTVPQQMNNINHEVLKLIDGISLWPANQNITYKKYDSYIKTIEDNYPEKDILPGVYIYYNNNIKYLSSESIRYIINQTIDLYEKGKVAGLLVFSPVWLAKGMIPRGEWTKLAIPRFLDSVYYPYLGEVEGRVIGKISRKPVNNLLVTVSRKINNRNSTVTQKFTNGRGYFRFGAWAGKRNGDVYKITFAKSGFKSDSIFVIPKRGKKLILPVVSLGK